MATESSDQEIADDDHSLLANADETSNQRSGELPSSALPAILDGISRAEEDLKNDIQQYTLEASPDVDGWVAKAKRLQAEIERSKATAREIVQEAEAGRAMDAHVTDLADKVDLLKRELDFNETLVGTLEQLQVAVGLLDSVQDAVAAGELKQALEKLGNVGNVIQQLEPYGTTRFTALVEKRNVSARESVIAKVQEAWNRLAVVDTDAKSLTVLHELPDSDLSLEDAAEAMSRLQTLDICISRLHRDLDTIVIGPLLRPTSDGAVPKLDMDEQHIRITTSTQGGVDAIGVMNNVYGIVKFLTQALPKTIYMPLLEGILPSLILQLISDWLDPSMPLDPDTASRFEPVIARVSSLADFIIGIDVSMPSDADLTTWIAKMPQNWLARRREAALASLRRICFDGVTMRKTAERVETQVVSNDDVMVVRNPPQGSDKQQQDEDWNAGWSGEEEDGDQLQKEANKTVDQETDKDKNDDDDADASAWGLEDPEEDAGDEEIQQGMATKGEGGTQQDDDDEDDDADAWGWGDDNEGPEEKQSVAEPQSGPVSKGNGNTPKPQATQREITLRETFSVTAIPDSVLDLISKLLEDAMKLSAPDFPISAISSAAPAVVSMSTLLLAMYRATAVSIYESDAAGNMLIYNDTQHLITKLQEFVANLPVENSLSKRLRLDTDIRQLGTFARRAYGREMDSQRTILSDLLSGTSGFTRCTNPLNAREYTNAINDATQRVRDVESIWKGVLSDSARLQSLGSLLGTLVRKMVTDILELADEPAGISEDESRMLKRFCDQVADLANLFNEPSHEQGEPRSLVHVYTPHWLRFIYLGEILEASLADIKFLWLEGELSLEFEEGEVIDLIQALFADSEHRRAAIREIKTSPLGVGGVGGIG